MRCWRGSPEGLPPRWPTKTAPAASGTPLGIHGPVEPGLAQSRPVRRRHPAKSGTPDAAQRADSGQLDRSRDSPSPSVIEALPPGRARQGRPPGVATRFRFAPPLTRPTRHKNHKKRRGCRKKVSRERAALIRWMTSRRLRLQFRENRSSERVDVIDPRSPLDAKSRNRSRLCDRIEP